MVTNNLNKRIHGFIFRRLCLNYLSLCEESLSELVSSSSAFTFLFLAETKTTQIIVIKMIAAIDPKTIINGIKKEAKKALPTLELLW